MRVTISALLLIILLILLANIIYADSLPIVLRPKINSQIQPNTAFNYTFTFASDSSCTDVIYTNSTSLTTDSYGIGFVELDISNMTESPRYLCEYRNSILRKTHSIGTSLGNRGLFYGNLSAVLLNITGNITASGFIGNGSMLESVYAVGIADNIVSSGKISADSVNTTHILDRTISSLDLSSDSVNSSHIEDSGVRSSDIASGSVNASHIVSASVNAVHINTSQINSSHILDYSITAEDISNSTNLTLGSRISFSFGEIIENIMAGWLRITGSLSITQNLSVSEEVTVGGVSSDGAGRILCIRSDGALGTCSSRIRNSGGIDTCTCT